MLKTFDWLQYVHSERACHLCSKAFLLGTLYHSSYSQSPCPMKAVAYLLPCPMVAIANLLLCPMVAVAYLLLCPMVAIANLCVP